MKKIIKLVMIMFITNTINAQLTINISNISPIKGDVYIAIFNDSASFPEAEKAYLRKMEKVSGETTSSVLDNLPNGEYVVAVYHDKNSNDKMDKNMVGIPKEAYGFSNDARATFSEPDYNDAKFYYENKKSITINIK